MLYSPRSRRTAEALKSKAQTAGIEAVLIKADRKNFRRPCTNLNQQDCEGELMLPDFSVYNSINVRELLLWGIRQKRPVWAFSENIVKAGSPGRTVLRTGDGGKQTRGTGPEST